MENKFAIAVGGALFRDGKLLVMRRAPTKKTAPGMYDTPGGSVEFGETLEGALRREWKEETGLDITIGKPFHAWTFFVDNGATQYACTEFFVTADPALSITMSNEHDDVRWVRRDDLAALPVSEEMRPAMYAAFDAAGL